MSSSDDQQASMSGPFSLCFLQSSMCHQYTIECSHSARAGSLMNACYSCESGCSYSRQMMSSSDAHVKGMISNQWSWMEVHTVGWCGRCFYGASYKCRTV